MSTSILTKVGENEISKKQQPGATSLKITKVCFANAPNDGAVSSDMTVQPQNDIVYTCSANEITASYDEEQDAVVYSVILGSDVGDFQFNQIGYYSEENVLIMIAKVPLVIKTVTSSTYTGNSYRHSQILKVKGVSELTQITMSKETWQLDFTTILNGLKDDINTVSTAIATEQTERTAAIEAAIQKAQKGRSEAEFKAMQEQKRAFYAGSGFIEWGWHYDHQPRDLKIEYHAVNYGVSTFSHNDSADDQLKYGILFGENDVAINRVAPREGFSKTKESIVLVDGVVIHFGQINLDSSYIPAVDSTPRQDLVVLEVWHENIKEKNNVVYPLGNTQYGSAQFESISGLTQGNDFDGCNTYSLAGDWQSSGDIIGYHAVWGNLSPEDQNHFLSDPRHNLYVSENGDLVQVRYRIRVMKGLSGDWERYNPLLFKDEAFQFKSGDTADFVYPRGKSANLASDMGGNDGNLYHHFSDALYDSEGTFSLIKSHPNPDSIAYQGKCFAMPLLLLQRDLNSGAFHPVYNPRGTAMLSSSITAGQSLPWYGEESELGYKVASQSECFNKAVGGGLQSGKANVARPDGRFYDTISPEQVKDLRKSAHKITDKQSFLDEQFRKLALGEVKGWEKGDFVTYLGTLNRHVSATLYDETTVTFTGLAVESAPNYTIKRQVYPTRGILLSGSNGNHIFINRHDYAVESDQNFPDEHGNVYIKVNTKEFADDLMKKINQYFPSHTPGIKVYVVNNALTIDRYHDELSGTLQCDIIGDPKNYPAEWDEHGVMGTPNLFDVNTGKRQLPEDVLANPTSLRRSEFRLQKTAEKLLLVLRNGKPVNTIINDVVEGKGYNTPSQYSTTNGNSILHSLENRVALPVIESNDYIQIFYEAKAIPLNSASTTAHRATGDVFLTNHKKFGGVICESLSDKTAGNRDAYGISNDCYPVASYERASVKSSIPNREKSFEEGSTILHEESTYSFASDSQYPGVKALPILATRSGTAVVQLLAKEMVYNIILLNFTSESFEVKLNQGSLYKFVFPSEYNALYNQVFEAKTSATIDLQSGVCKYQTAKFATDKKRLIDPTLTDPNLKEEDKILPDFEKYFVHVQGEKIAWGDDQRFIVADNINTTQDRNGNAVRYGLLEFETNHYLD